MTFECDLERGPGVASSRVDTPRPIELRLMEFASCAAAPTQRCAGEGDLVCGLSKHGASLANPVRSVNRRFYHSFVAIFAGSGGFLRLGLRGRRDSKQLRVEG